MTRTPSNSVESRKKQGVCEHRLRNRVDGSSIDRDDRGFGRSPGGGRPRLTRRDDDGTAVEAVDGRENDEDVIEIAEKNVDHHLAAAVVSEHVAQVE